MRQTAKYIAACKTAKSLKIKPKSHQELYLKLTEAGYEWNPETGWNLAKQADLDNPKAWELKMRLVVATPYAATIATIFEGMLRACSKPFLKIDGPSISPSRKEEGFSLIYFTFKLPGYDRKFPKD
ncbi:hypothetical protein NG798_23375 [Ancylothrix sp. C2]|uniref:hypothetical protein n=1 Tax=Ancylothrix sp. D3o TaxID=2953691 RepID=UPI0021BA4949|nr:hypothetical protein [Ancylothrix sp. D3o]MCT7952746.1 hypothetical protein [Ancylothrix sp. D3o]